MFHITDSTQENVRLDGTQQNIQPACILTAWFSKAALTRSDFVEFDYVESSFASDLSNRMPLLHDQIFSN